MIYPGDVIIKEAISLGLEDLRNNPWIIEDIFSEFIENPILSQKYGMKEVNRAKEYLLNNKVNVFMAHRIDKEEFPLVTIAVSPSVEDKDLATLADASTCYSEYSPDQINKPIKYIINPIEIESYDITTGTVIIPENENFKYISPGMLLVDPDTGNAYEISGKAQENQILITPGTKLIVEKVGIAPRYQFYKARRGRIISQESYEIGCHAHGDTSFLIFLYAAVKYVLLRYREGLLEHNNFQLSKISSSEIIKNNNYQSDNVYSRFITLSGQVEESWVQTPQRYVEAIDIIDKSVPISGVKIISNENSAEDDNGLWTTIDSE